MRKIWNKGHRIRASDKHLVYHFSIGTLLFVFVAVLLLLNIKQLMRTDWEHFSLLENGLTLSPYNFITILIATGVCALVAFLYYRFCYDSFKKLLHRQKLARMVLENKWYEADTVQDSGFFTDLQSRSREKIVWFPKIYYQMEKGLLHIRCEITLGKYQDQLLRLEDKLESGLYCELTDKTLRFVDEEPDKRKNDWKLNDRWAWFIGDNRQSLKLTTKPEPYTLDRTLRWVQRQVAPTLKMLKNIDKGNGTDYMETIEQQAKLTEKHEMIIKQQTTPAKDLVES